MATAAETAPRPQPAVPATDDRTRTWRRVGVAMLAAVGVATLSFTIGAGEVIPPIIVFASVMFVLAGLVAAFGGGHRWPWIAGAVGSFGLLALNLPFVIFEIGHPEEAYTFIPLVLVVVGAAVAFTATVAVAIRKSPPARPILGVAGALAAVAVVVSVAAAMGVESHAQQAGDVVLVAEKVKFPEQFEVTSGAWLYLDNQDRIRHTFTIDGHLDVDLPFSTGRRVQVALPAGDYTFYCAVPGHESMTGTLTVRGASAAR